LLLPIEHEISLEPHLKRAIVFQEGRERMSFFPDQITTVIIPPDDKRETIRTERLILRPLQISDAQEIFSYRSLKTVADWL
jgi:hypothetical protein